MKGDDFFDRDVNLAAPIGAAATGGEILVSGLLHELVAAVALQGLAGAYRIDCPFF